VSVFSMNAEMCRGCGEFLDFKNISMADGCPCNSPRGVNHGIVMKSVCTCSECDPEQTGGSRMAAQQQERF
jgi:hypothetical protein